MEQAIIIQFIKSTRDSTLRSRKKNHAVSRFYDSRCAINFKNATSFAHSRAILNVTLHKYATIHCDSAVALGKRGTISISLNLIFSKLALSDGLIEKRFIIYYSSICWDGRKNKDCIDGDPSNNAKSTAVQLNVCLIKSSALFSLAPGLSLRSFSLIISASASLDHIPRAPQHIVDISIRRRLRSLPHLSGQIVSGLTLALLLRSSRIAYPWHGA